MKIIIEFIPHDKQRYPTLGDYWIDDKGDWQIRISKLLNIRSEIAVALHELFEMAAVVYKHGPSIIKKIDEFDIMFEHEIWEGRHPKDAEPGYDPRAPYWSEHFNAEIVERLFLTHTGLMWSLHEENCENA